MVRVVAALAVLLAAPAAADPGTCAALHCGVQLAKCLLDSVCRQWSSCTGGCKQGDLACQIRCADLYKPTDDTAVHINEFSECVISDNHCVPQETMQCPVPANAAVTSGFKLEQLTGTWYITRGWNALFDCFDCQVHTFSLQDGETPKLVGDLKYEVKKDLTCTAPSCEYIDRKVTQSFVQDSANAAHLMNHNNSAADLHYADDWYVLAAKEDAYALIYYCGCNDATCGYSGAVLYTRVPTFEALADTDVADLRAAVAAAQVEGFNFDGFCTPNNAACMPSFPVSI